MITKETINKVKELSIVKVLSSFITLKKKGKDYVCCCPFHNEKTPSFTVSETKGIYKCFGCGESGDNISFIMKHERKNYPEAIKFLCLKNDIVLEEDKPKEYLKPSQRLEKLLPATIKWFESRGISNNTTLRHKITETNEWMPKADKPVPAICFNFFVNDELINIKFRSKNKDFKLAKDSKLILYNLDALQNETIGVIVEGEMDCLALYEAGIYNAISVPNGASINGLNNLDYIENSWEHIKHIQKWIFFTDNDAPGNKLADELALRFGRSNCLQILPISDCKDANDILLKHGPETIKRLIETALPMVQPPTKKSSFPFEVFSDEIRQSFEEVAYEYSIPQDYFGLAALFTISALSGSMYTTEVGIQNSIYGMLIGPSGLGKSPAYNLVCGDIVEPLEQQLFDNWKLAYKEWDDKRNDAKHAKPPYAFKDHKPDRKVRTAKGGTVEGIMAHSMTSPAGFGLYYDEGGKMMGSPNAYKKDTSAVDFWNEIWNGKYFNELRSDSERERFGSKTRISCLIGMQTDRVQNYFTKDATDSGLAFRFLFTQAEYIHLNENVDHFTEKRKLCDDWRCLVQFLFKKGAYDFFKDDLPYQVNFTDTAKLMYNQISGNFISGSNELRESRKIGDTDDMLIGYESKLYSYFGRFMLVLAIMKDAKQPVIDETCVDGAFKLYNYFKEQAQILFSRLSTDSQTDLSQNERSMLDALPNDREFTKEDIAKVTKDLKMADRFFYTAFRRKYKMGWVKKTANGKYIKE